MPKSKVSSLQCSSIPVPRPPAQDFRQQVLSVKTSLDPRRSVKSPKEVLWLTVKGDDNRERPYLHELPPSDVGDFEEVTDRAVTLNEGGWCTCRVPDSNHSSLSLLLIKRIRKQFVKREGVGHMEAK